MTVNKSSSRIAIAGISLTYLLSMPVQAHENHDHSRDSDANANHDMPAAADESLADEATSQTKEDNLAPTEEPQAVEGTSVQTIPVAQPTTEAGLIKPGAIGLGELLFGLIIAAPFFLISLKKRLQSPR